MRIYVDELPNSCEECPMCRSGKLKLQRKGRYIEAEQCVFGQYKYHTIDDEIDTCPLQSLSDYTKQVRKEVLSELRNMLGDRAELIDFGNGCAEFMFTTYDLQECSKEILDQIEQGETKGE